MFRSLKKSGITISFLLAGFLFLVTLRESCGQIEVLPGEPASPVEGINTTQRDDVVDAELKRLELVLSEPLIFFIKPTFEEEEYVYSK